MSTPIETTTADAGEVVQAQPEEFTETWLVQYRPDSRSKCWFYQEGSRADAQFFMDGQTGVDRKRIIRIPAEGEPSAVEALRACVEVLSGPHNPPDSAKFAAAIALAEAVPGVTT